MILQAKANENDLDAQAKQIFDVLTLLNRIDYLKPRYLTVSRKRDVKDFELSLDNVKNLIYRSNDKVIPDLGSRFSFFSSLNDSESVGISISIGVSNLKFSNTLVINLNTDIKDKAAVSYDELANLFLKIQ